MTLKSSQQAQHRLLSLTQERGVVYAMLTSIDNGIALVRLWEDFRKTHRKRSTDMEYTREWLQQELVELDEEITGQVRLLREAIRRELVT